MAELDTDTDHWRKRYLEALDAIALIREAVEQQAVDLLPARDVRCELTPMQESEQIVAAVERIQCR